MPAPRPVYLFTDFGWAGPYVGQMVAAIQRVDPRIPAMSLMHDAPAMRPRQAAYLLAACARYLPPRAVIVAVVDPGVGSERLPLLVETPLGTFVGPDNGLLTRVEGIQTVSVVDWRPGALSDSFHGRDLFAPVAAQVALGEPVSAHRIDAHALVGADWPSDLAEIVYVDGYGNLMIGMSAEKISKNSSLSVGGVCIRHARTFSRVMPGELFWYANSQGLVEIAANQASAAQQLGLAVGDALLLD